MERKTKKRFIGLIIIFVGVIGIIISFQTGIGMYVIIILGIILLVGLTIAGGGISDSWVSSD